MNIEVLRSVEELEQLRPEWLQLYVQCPRATPFQSPQWLLPWMRHLFGGGDVLAMAMRSDSRLIGFAPLFCWGVDERTVSFLGAGVSDYGDILFDPGFERACAAEVWSFLERCHDRWEVLDVKEIREGSALLEGLEPEQCSVCPVLLLSSYPESMDHKHRTDVRRARNRLTDCSEMLFTPNMEEFFRLYEARWGAMEASLRRFHTDVAAGFNASGDLRLALLRIDDVPAAVIYAFTAGRTLYCYLSGFEPTLAKRSPGAVLLAWLIEQAISEGIQHLDFLRNPEAYKYLWGARDRISYKLSHLGRSQKD